MHRVNHLMLPKALLFDMDGTLTRPILDFPRIKRDIGIREDEAILEAMAKMSPQEFAAATVILDDHEARAADQSTLNNGCEALLKWIKSTNIGIALVTRNSRASVDTVLGKHDLKIDVVVTREDGDCKPAPDPVYLACERLDCGIDDAWMIGDGHHDIEAAAAAKMRSVWISHGEERRFNVVPIHTFNDLPELHAFLRSCDVSR